jgi:hypothetical protein
MGDPTWLGPITIGSSLKRRLFVHNSCTKTKKIFGPIYIHKPLKGHDNEIVHFRFFVTNLLPTPRRKPALNWGGATTAE